MTDLGGKRKEPTPYDLINYLSPQSFIAKYLVFVVEKGITSEVMHFILLKATALGGGSDWHCLYLTPLRHELPLLGVVVDFI